MQVDFRNRLSYRQTLNTVLIAFVIGTILSGIQIGYDLINEREQVDSTVAQVVSMLEESAAAAVFNVDRSMTETVVNGLFQYKPIYKAQVVDDFDVVLGIRERVRTTGTLNWLVTMVFGREKSLSIPLYYHSENPIGRIQIAIDNYLIAKNFLNRACLILISGLIRNIVLSCVLTLVFYYTLTRPLFKMTSQVSLVDPAKPARELIIIPKEHEKDEIGLLVTTVNSLLEGFEESLAKRRAVEKELKNHRDHLEQIVDERTAKLRDSLYREHETNVKLNKTLEKVEEANKEITAGIHYAKIIQKALLPAPDEIKSCLPQNFLIWMPKEIVSGDIFFVNRSNGGIIVAVIDCTGHGVPGAFMSMLACSAFERAVKDEKCHDPAKILKRLNHIVKNLLHKDPENNISNDGMDAAICFIDNSSSVPADRRKLIFAGAKIPLIYIHENKLKTIKADRHSIGYNISDVNFDFTNHILDIEKGMRFYIASDGYEDQLGGEKCRRFGKKRFRNLLFEISSHPFAEQQKMLLESSAQYRGENERQDDVTLLGFGF